MKFSGICLITHNVPLLENFYTQVLEVESMGDEVHVELQTDGAGMTIFSVEGMDKLAPKSMQGAGHGSFTIGFEVNDVDAEYNRLKALNVDFIKLPTSHPWGTRSLWFRDPDGNIVNFFCDLTKE